MVLITFDDLETYVLFYPIELAPIPNGYKKLNWSNFIATKAKTFEEYEQIFNFLPPEFKGIINGLVSPNNNIVGFGSPFICAINKQQTFNLNSGYFTVSNDNPIPGEQLLLGATAYNASNNILYSHTYKISPYEPTLIKFNWINVYKVTFFTNNWSFIVLDNFDVDFNVHNISTNLISNLNVPHNVQLDSNKKINIYLLNPLLTFGEYKFYSSNKNIADIDSLGNIILKSVGNFSITVTDLAGKIIYKSKTIQINCVV